MNDSQRAAWDRHRDHFLIDVPAAEMDTSIADDAHVDWDAVFGRRAPRIVEIGSGNGDSLVPMAAARPESDFIAFEVFPPGIASTMGRLGREGVGNVRIVPANGAQGLAVLFDDDSLTELWTFFADPWRKTRHHKRRLVSPAFADKVARVLKPGGQLHIWHTDSREAINQIHAKIKDPTIASDVLPPAEEVADVLKKAGFTVSQAAESAKDYLVTARKP